MNLIFLNPKVNVRTGLSGWHKRITRNYRAVSRTADLHDGHVLDPNRNELAHMHAAAKAAVLRKKGPVAKELGIARPLSLTGGALAIGADTSQASSSVAAPASNPGMVYFEIK